MAKGTKGSKRFLVKELLNFDQQFLTCALLEARLFLPGEDTVAKSDNELRELLIALPTKQLKSIFRQLLDAPIEAEFQSLLPPDYDKYLDLPLWTAEIATGIALGKDPEILSAFVKSNPVFPGIVLYSHAFHSISLFIKAEAGPGAGELSSRRFIDYFRNRQSFLAADTIQRLGSPPEIVSYPRKSSSTKLLDSSHRILLVALLSKYSATRDNIGSIADKIVSDGVKLGVHLTRNTVSKHITQAFEMQPEREKDAVN